MSGLGAHVDDYLRLRRALGFKLKEDERMLGQLVGYLEAAGAETVNSELAIGWARLPVGVHPNQWAKRLRIARGFAAYLQTIDPTTEIPPPDVFPDSSSARHPLPVLPTGHLPPVGGGAAAAPPVACGEL
jgi:integrase/recombinase XerD